ncbi:MAG: thiamine pyrophosphate-requiring protein [Chloroflexi bacterium]|nr:thiamine pyrophosphate-requiring protein [Chloroflexota bacterium]
MSARQSIRREEASPALPETIAVGEGAEAFVELLTAHGVRYLFLNPGTDTFPVQEAIVKRRALGRTTPEVVVCPHESVALHAAYGYWMVSGQPQAVMVHVDVGTANGAGALLNCQRGRAAVLFCAGRTPITEGGEMRGSRSTAVHWIQEQRDQNGLVRSFVKWDYELRRNENIGTVVHRAFQVASAEPSGPVYLALPREVLMEPMAQVQVPCLFQHQPPSSPQADPEAIATAARWLAEAESPLIITEYLGRHPEAVTALVELAELLVAPVIDGRTRANFPTQHPLHLGYEPQPYLDEADVVLLLDCDVPYVRSAAVHPSPRARTIHIDIDAVKQDMPIWGFPVDLSVQADCRKAIPALTAALRPHLEGAGRRAAREARRARLMAAHQAQRAQWREAALSSADRRPITAEWLAYCLNEATDADCLFLDEVVTNSPVAARYLQRVGQGNFFRSGGSCLGWGLGAALGARLAAPDKTVVCLLGDGAFMYCQPVSALWAADKHHAPFLTVIFNNRVYHAVKRATKAAYPEGYSVMSQDFATCELDPPPEYALVARACRAHGETVTEPDQVLPALRRALDQVRSGRAAVVDVHIQKP